MNGVRRLLQSNKQCGDAHWKEYEQPLYFLTDISISSSELSSSKMDKIFSSSDK